MPAQDASDVGPDQKYSEPVKKYDAAAGTYQSVIPSVPLEDLLPTAQLPKGADPSPFTMGPMTSGER